MIRMSRVGRKRHVRAKLITKYLRRKGEFFSVGQIARMMGMKSSTYLKNILRELERECDDILTDSVNGVEVWRYQEYEQMSFLDRPILINGVYIKYRDLPELQEVKAS